MSHIINEMFISKLKKKRNEHIKNAKITDNYTIKLIEMAVVEIQKDLINIYNEINDELKSE